MRAKRCDDCPVPPEIGCPAVYLPHERYCSLAHIDIHKNNGYRELILTKALADKIDPSVDRRVKKNQMIPLSPRFEWIRGDVGVRWGIAAGYLGTGGCERWAIDLIEAVRSHHSYAGSAWHDYGDRTLRHRLEALGPVAFGPAAIRSLAHAVDVLLILTIGDFASIDLDPPCRTVFVSHGSCDWTKRCMEKGGRIDHCVAVAKAAGRGFEELGREYKVIHNCVNHHRLGTRSEESMNWLLRPIRIGQVGRLSDEKNPQATIDAAVIARDLQMPIQFSFHGRGVAPELVHQYARDRGVFHSIGWKDFREDVASIYDAIDILLCPSHDEGFGLVIAEAWASRIPVIATPVGIVKDFPKLVEELPPKATGEAIVHAIFNLITNIHTDAIKSRIERARFVSSTCYSMNRFQHAWIDFFDTIQWESKSWKLRKVRRSVSSCEYRGDPVGCSCEGFRTCALNRGSRDGIASYQECFKCQSEILGSNPPKSRID